MLKLIGPVANAVAMEMSPQVIMIRAIQTRAPKRCIRRLLGISNMKYPKKNKPAAQPNIVAVSPRSWFMLMAAKPMLVRSR
ncbi:hypothetical protein D9M73_224830 [compost metagenome]